MVTKEFGNTAVNTHEPHKRGSGWSCVSVDPLTIQKDNRRKLWERIHLYIHAYIFHTNSYTMYVCVCLSEYQYENAEQKKKKEMDTSERLCLNCWGENSLMWFSRMIRTANSFWEPIISSVSCLLLRFFKHISHYLRHTAAKMHEAWLLCKTNTIPHVDVQYKAACPLISSPAVFFIFSGLLQVCSIFHSFNCESKCMLFIPLPPMALVFHFYAHVSIKCKMRNFNNECRLNASTA